MRAPVGGASLHTTNIPRHPDPSPRCCHHRRQGRRSVPSPVPQFQNTGTDPDHGCIGRCCCAAVVVVLVVEKAAAVAGAGAAAVAAVVVVQKEEEEERTTTTARRLMFSVLSGVVVAVAVAVAVVAMAGARRVASAIGLLFVD